MCYYSSVFFFFPKIDHGSVAPFGDRRHWQSLCDVMPSRRHRGLTLSVVTHGGRPERWRDAIGEHAQTTTSSRGQLNFGHFARCIDARLMISGGWRLLPATATQVSSGGHFSAYLARHAVMRQVLILPTISLVFFSRQSRCSPSVHFRYAVVRSSVV